VLSLFLLLAAAAVVVDRIWCVAWACDVCNSIVFVPVAYLLILAILCRCWLLVARDSSLLPLICDFCPGILGEGCS
jgi:hypothetical protein